MSRLRRSLLFVPGAEPRKLERAREAGADTLLFDLEDSVPPAQKVDARAHVAAAYPAAGGFGGTEAAVRVNAPDTEHFEADVEAVIASGGRTIMLPKAESADGVAAAAAVLRARERVAGRADSVRLLLPHREPRGVAAAVAIGRAAPQAEALCFGHADFSLQMGLGDADASRGVVYHARCALAIAARACGVAPIDSVFLAVRDDVAFREDAALGCRLGFDGKLCIHPRQVEIVNDVYTPGSGAGGVREPRRRSVGRGCARRGARRLRARRQDDRRARRCRAAPGARAGAARGRAQGREGLICPPDGLEKTGRGGGRSNAVTPLEEVAKRRGCPDMRFYEFEAKTPARQARDRGAPGKTVSTAAEAEAIAAELGCPVTVTSAGG